MRKVWLDKNSNTLIAENNSISLKIKGQSRVRKLFDINKEKDFIYTRRKREKHLLHKANAYGFNWDVLQSAEIVNNVLLQDEKGMYLIPIRKILDDGQFLHFKQQQYELQIFLGLDEIEKNRVDPKKFSGY